MRILSIAAPSHGRVLVREVAGARAALLGFHGYMENAEIQMERLLGLPVAEGLTLVSVQALHRFYKGRTQEVVASWMTRQDRELMIADNIEYANRVIAATLAPGMKSVCAGFSQGVATAFRAACRAERRADAVIAVGGDVPPDLLEDPDVAFPPVLLARGRRDEWYTDERLESDVAALSGRGPSVSVWRHDGGHEWNADVSAAAGEFIAKWLW